MNDNTMKFGNCEKRIAIIALHQCGNTPKKIHSLLKKLPVNERFVFRRLARYRETADVIDRPREGRRCSVRRLNIVHAVRERVHRNPLRKQKRMSAEMGVSTRSMSRILREDLGLGAYRRCVSHMLTPKLKEIRRTRCAALLQRFPGKKYRKILFSDEKIFTIEEKFNRQNDRVYAHNCYEAKENAPRVQRRHHPTSVMVWWGVSYHGVTDIHFCEAGVKTNASVYEKMLEDVVEPLSESLFAGKPWCFQQDSAPAHKAKIIQQWLAAHIPDFTTVDKWASGSPDLNPLDYSLWAKLEETACDRTYTDLESLKASIVRAAREMPLHTVREAIDAWPHRQRARIDASGGHFDYFFAFESSMFPFSNGVLFD